MRPSTSRPRRVATRRRRTARSWRQPRWRTAAVALPLALTATACGSADDSDLAAGDESAADVDAVESAPAFEVTDDMEDGEVAERDDSDGTQSSGSSAPRGLQVIRDAAITLQLEDTEGALGAVRSIAERGGGTVATADLRRDRPAGELGGIIVLRVPSDELLGMLEELEDLAVDAPVRRIDERDVTGEVVDLRARIINLTAYETELRELLTEVREGGSDPNRLLPVFERVNEIRSEIDRLTAQRDELADRVARSTITVTIEPAPGSEPVENPTWAPLTTLERAVATSLSALAALADVAIWLVVVILPVVAVFAVPAVLLARTWRRRRVAAAVPTGAAPTAPPPEEGGR
jgi:hypothetical protein